MATAKRHQSAQQKVAQYLLGTLTEGLNLAYRFRDSDGFRTYVQRRIGLVAPIVVLIVLTSLACTAATVLYLGGMRPLLVLLAILLVPFVLAGSLFVQAYVFFFWLESTFFRAWNTSTPARSASPKLSKPTGAIMNSCRSTLLAACAPPFRIFMSGTGSSVACAPPRYR